MYVSFNLVNRDPRGKERSQTIGSPLATEEAKLDAKTFDLNKMGSRDVSLQHFTLPNLSHVSSCSRTVTHGMFLDVFCDLFTIR